MPIDFDSSRWEALKETYRKFWAGELDRPVIPIELVGRDPGRTKPNVPLLTQKTCADFSVPVEDLIDRIDYELSCHKYLGDSFPYFNMDVFGPGVIAAFMGGILDNSSGRVWFYPPEELPIEEIHFEFNPDNKWFKRQIALYEAGMDRWGGSVLISMTDLGGNMDILSAWRPSEKLLLDLYDNPEEVKRLVWEAHEAWHGYYEAINIVLQPTNPGYSDWSSIYSEKPSYMLQCDFSYMISPKMFVEFALPELNATCKRLPHTFYHLDGIGQLPHLDLILEIEELDGVQWVPGDGKPGCAHWPEVYQRINQAGKKMQIIEGGFEAIDAVINQIGTRRNVNHRIFYQSIEEEAEVRKKLMAYGIGAT